jgi:branched-chain amino acid transport system permease protein
MDSFFQITINSLISGSGYILIALGFGLTYSVTRLLNFGHTAIFAASAYCFYFLHVTSQLDFSVSFLIAVSFGALLGCIFEILVYRFLRVRGSKLLNLLLASFAILLIFQSILSLSFGDDTKVLPRLIEGGSIGIYGAFITPTQLAIVFVALLIALVSCIFLYGTRLGEAIRAVADDPLLAFIVGVDSDNIYVLVSLLGSVLTGVGGILLSYEIGADPTMGFHAVLLGLVAVIVGGVGSVPGIIAGAFFVAIVREGSGWILPSMWRESVVFLILVLFLYFRPLGFMGRPIRGAQF